MVGDAPQAVLVRHHDLAGGHVPEEAGADGVQGAALRGEDVASVQGADAQGAEAVGVPGGDELLGGEEHQGVSPLDDVHGGGDGGLDGGGLEPGAGDGVGDDLGVAGGVEDGAGELQPLPELGGVGEVSVVAQGHGALHMVDDHGLGVGAALPAGGGVAHMAHGDAAGAQALQDLRGEYLADQSHVLVAGDDAVVVDGDAGALLAPVLKGVQGVVDAAGGMVHAVYVQAENAAFLVEGRHGSYFLFHWDGTWGPGDHSLPVQQ